MRGIAYQHVIERERSASAYYPVPYAAMLALLLHLVSECFSGEWFSVSIDDAVSRHLLVSGCKLSRMCTFHLCLSSLWICCRISYSSVQQQVVRTSAAGPSERTRSLKLHRRSHQKICRQIADIRHRAESRSLLILSHYAFRPCRCSGPRPMVITVVCHVNMCRMSDLLWTSVSDVII